MIRNPLHFLCLACLLGLSVSAIDVPKGFTAETLVTGLHATTAFTQAPDGRLFIADQTGIVRIWKDGRLLPAPALVLGVATNLGRGLVSLTLAPDFPHPPHLFVLQDAEHPVGELVVARYTVEGDQADPNSRVVVLKGQHSSPVARSVPPGSFGGTLCFAPDGTLWVGIDDQMAGEASDNMDTLEGKIHRVKPDGQIPPYNPGRKWLDRRYWSLFAKGVHQPSGLAVQPRWEGGRAFFVDSGRGPVEVHELIAGSHYGIPEGMATTDDEARRDPVFADGTRSIPDGAGGSFCSRRSSWPAVWRGRFFFASPSGNSIHTLDPDRPTETIIFGGGFDHPIALEFEPDGSLLVLNRGSDFGGEWSMDHKPSTGSLVRIRFADQGRERTTGRPEGSSIPSHRVALGLPKDPRDLPKTINLNELFERLAGADRQWFWLNHGPWHRGVDVHYAMALPPGQPLRISGQSEVLFPPGTVFVRHFRRNPAGTVFGNGKGPVRFETRLTVVGVSGAYGASYRWRKPHPTPLDEAEYADLVEEGALANVGTSRVWDPVNGRRVEHSISWWFPGIDDRLSWPSLNPDYHIPTRTWELTTLLNAFRQRFDPPLPTNIVTVASKYRSAGEPAASLEEKARSFLHGCCAICHQPGGASPGTFDVRLPIPLSETGLIHGLPGAGDLGIDGARLLVPGDPGKSLLYQRIVRPSPPNVPPGVHFQEGHPAGPVIEEWIRRMTPP